jgi:hypothetical protein
MGMVANTQRIASSFKVHFGRYGEVSQYAAERGVSRQWVYREAGHVLQTLDSQPWRAENSRLRQRVRELEEQQRALKQRLAQAVVLDDEKQAEFASVGQALGVSLPNCRDLLEVLRPGQVSSVATLGRRSHEAGQKAGPLLAVLDAWTRAQVQQAAADEIYVSKPVLMVVEPESLCWVSSRLSAAVNGPAWAQEFQQLPQLQQVLRDGGKGLEKGVALVNAQRVEQGQPRLVDQGDHFQALHGSSLGLRHLEAAARQALEDLEAAEKKLAEQRRQGHKLTGPTAAVTAALGRARRKRRRKRCQEPFPQKKRLLTPCMFISICSAILAAVS